MLNIFVYGNGGRKRLYMSTVYDVREAVKMIEHYVRKFSRSCRSDIDGSFSFWKDGRLAYFYYEKDSGWKFF